LELDGGVKILIDAGWDETFDVGKLKELERYHHASTLYTLEADQFCLSDRSRPSQ
jgi:hypothetical protein